MADQDGNITPDVKDFKLLEILSNDAARKKIVLLGTISSEESKMILFIEKVEFSEETFKTEDVDEKFLKHIALEVQMANDIYADFIGLIDPRFNSKFLSRLLAWMSFWLYVVLELKVNTIYPATDAHVKKYSRQEFVTFNETPEMYSEVTLPYLSSQKFSVDWVYNILEGKKEADRVDFKDEDPKNGFLLARDLKWNGQVESLHMTAIVFDRSIKSLRDLDATHLPLLENIRKNSFATIKSKYGLDETKIRAYLHYQPSYYHLHVHFTNLSFDTPGIHCDRGHILSSVINNIQLVPDYYQKATIPFVTGKSFALYDAIVKYQHDKADN